MHTNVTVSIPNHMAKKMDTIVKREGTTTSAHLRRLIQRDLSREKASKSKSKLQRTVVE